MLTLTPEQSAELAMAVNAAMNRPELAPAIDDVYQSVQREIDERRPACAMSGRCCHFEAYGHRLFVSTIELAVFAARAAAARRTAAPWNGLGCPFQVGGLCGAHAIRPFGCRIYFCDPTAQQWQQDCYERHHALIKSLHERLDVPYYYVEWRAGLRAIGLGSP